MRMRYFPLWFCGLTLAIGCQRTETPDAVAFGRFEGDIVSSWDGDGRNMTLRETFAYVDSQNRRWMAPAGSVVNGASIPVAFWSLVGGPFEGQYRNASVVHDVGCAEMTATWEDVHRMFYEACRCGGVDETKAKMLYYAVYHFGPRWQPVTTTRVETRTNAAGQVVQEQVTEQRMVRFDPPPPTLEEVQQVHSLIAEENPAPAEIEQTNRAVLHRRPRDGSGHGRPGDVSGGPSSPGETDRIAAKRPEGAEDNKWDGVNLSERVEGPVATGSERTWQKNGQHEKYGQRSRRTSEPQAVPAAPDLPVVTPEEQQWAAAQVRQHLEELAGQERPAEYGVERTEDGYRITVEYVQLDEQGQPTGDASGSSTVRLSDDGQVLEMISGM